MNENLQPAWAVTEKQDFLSHPEEQNAKTQAVRKRQQMLSVPLKVKRGFRIVLPWQGAGDLGS